VSAAFLGYEPDRVRTLRRALLLASDDVERLRRLAATMAAGPAVTAALDDVRRTLDHRWRPMTDRVMSCAALEGSPWSIGAGGWVVDARGSAVGASATVEQWAARLGVRWLALAGQWQGGKPTDSSMRALQHEARQLAGAVRPADVDALLARLAPVVGALLLPWLSLDDRHLARAAATLQRRERDASIDLDLDVVVSWGSAQPNTTDLLATYLATRPRAAALWAVEASRTPGVLFTAFDRGTEQAALLAATRPGAVPAAEAGLILATLLADAHHRGALPTGDDSSAPQWRQFLGTISAPWLPELASGTGRFAWDDTVIDQGIALRHVLADGAAAEHLADAEDRWVSKVVRGDLLTPDGQVDHARIDHLARVTVAMADARRDVGLVDAAADRRLADLVTDGIDYVLTKSVAFVPVIGPGMAGMAGPAVQQGRRWLDDRGWYPPDATEAERSAATTFGGRTASLQMLAVVATAGELIERGALPASFLDEMPLPRSGCQADTVDADLRSYVLRFETAHPQATSDLLAVIGAFGNRTVAAELC
jgi:hypothetical protein